MKLATVNPRMEFNMEALLSKDVSWSNFLVVFYEIIKKPLEFWIRLLNPLHFQIFQSRGSSLPQSIYPLDSSALAFPFGYQPQQAPSIPNGIPNGTETPFSVTPLSAATRRTPSMPLPAIDGFGEAASQVMTQISSSWRLFQWCALHNHGHNSAACEFSCRFQRFGKTIYIVLFRWESARINPRAFPVRKSGDYQENILVVWGLNRDLKLTIWLMQGQWEQPRWKLSYDRTFWATGLSWVLYIQMRKTSVYTKRERCCGSKTCPVEGKRTFFFSRSWYFSLFCPIISATDSFGEMIHYEMK